MIPSRQEHESHEDYADRMEEAGDKEREIRQDREAVEPCDHDWKRVDDSFSHEFGTEIIVFERCQKCDMERPYSEPEYD